ncbi:hypothetical protein ACWT_1127 [Actinoplanes sp. SE50]|uniref:hypothetical protein n=1 Tax=unclassified Actinoplanes TaxID=2626549 RepID=UPI00023ECFCF|nr:MULTISPECIES: hypothetical protein [unclassified Actinoplanes]AEV82143.1 hypothetical protein ACPL_1246 [Actinoplanes sp. SE50/110]ATO80542.1 hypothetical protein ACWT_1127 [Actinoplanes sp. SE50]SLL97948.1 uncharacterized protein ACSP50_1164 [Actinoplanes sp. SE50/110]
MRFFTNEDKDDTDREDRADRAAAFPQQRAGSPWTDAPADETAAPGAHRDPAEDDTTRIDTLRPDHEDRVADTHAADATQEIHDHRDDDEDPVDVALDDRGTFDDPVVVEEPVVEEPAAEAVRDERAGDENRATLTETDPVVAVAEPIEAEPVAEPVVAVAGVPGQTPTAAGPSPFFPESETQPLRDRWREVQLRFVDDPKATTGEAAALVDETIEKLTSSLRAHRGSLATGADDTEALRVEFRAYRDILDRLLGL